MSAAPSIQPGETLARLGLDPATIRGRLQAGDTLPAELYDDPALHELEQHSDSLLIATADLMPITNATEADVIAD